MFIWLCIIDNVSLDSGAFRPKGLLLMYLVSFGFLAPPAERQRSFSNTDLSVVHLSVRPSVKIEGGGGVYLRNALVTFLIFWHEYSFGCYKSHIER